MASRADDMKAFYEPLIARLETERAELVAALREIANPNGAAYGRASAFARDVLARLGSGDRVK